ncbi:hypothetical protein CBR_g12440 [Chara braunii]|uniref:DUF3326 domain-containing protein n=1 Tax=Chara braunii TaxID=69332 RepID=A0A388JSF9_CHABU|nr:hypothetical protein CBR_g12440 [Chara braunii]|eukprot:GBG60703.1 hypothetical protein CBR_g12440 [Chara braunii]
MVNAKIASLSTATAALDASINSLAESLDHGRVLRARNRGSSSATPPQQASASPSDDLRSSVRQRNILDTQRTFRFWSSSYSALGASSRDEYRLGCSRASLQSCFVTKGGSFRRHGDFDKRSGEKRSNGSHPLRSHTRHNRHGGHCTCAAGPAQFGAGKRPYTVVMIVPTGVGATIGGYAGDALPVARTLASIADCLVTHPNIGIVFDAGIEDDLRLRHLQVADAAQATLGLSLGDYIITDMPLQVEKWIDPRTGASTGRLGRPDSLMRAVRKLLEGDDIDAVAVVGRFPDDSVSDLEEYRQGQGVDALAGVEAVISHMVVREFRVPCAHAPALQPIPLEPVSPRSAAEEPLLIAVEENWTVMDDTPGKLQLNAVIVNNYWEAAGVIAAHRAGVNPMSLRKEGVSSIKSRELDRRMAGVHQPADSQYYREDNRIMVNSY